MMLFSAWPYQSLGDSQNPPIVFLHGFMGSGDDWWPIAELCARRFFCLMPDLPGHGQNINLSPEQPLTFDTVSDGLFNFLGYHELEKANLVGYSMGGRVALYAAQKYPQKVNRLVLEGANPGITDEEARRVRANADDERAERLRADGVETFVDQWYELGLFQSLKVHPHLFEQTKAKRKQNNAQWLAQVISRLSPGRQPPLWDKLDTLPMPVMLVAGALDTKYAKLVKKMAAKIPDVTIEIVPNAGHNTHLERAEKFTQLIVDFL